jgi:hypothetical protein
MAERPAIFRTRRISTIYKIQIEKRGDWHTGQQLLTATEKRYGDFGRDKMHSLCRVYNALYSFFEIYKICILHARSAALSKHFTHNAAISGFPYYKMEEIC